MREIKKLTKALIWSLYSCSVSVAIAEDQINLLCEGNRLNTVANWPPTSAKPVESSQQTTLTVLLDLNNKLVKISGDWGCLAFLEGDPSCYGSIPVVLRDPEILGRVQTDGPKWTQNSLFTLNRNSGVFTINALGNSKPGSGSMMVIVTNSGSLKCEISKRKF